MPRFMPPLTALGSLVSLLFGLGGPVLAGDPAATSLADAGKRLVTAQCARCHAVEKTGASPLAAAPPFRTLWRKYPVDTLAEALAEGITTGHNDMPEFVFSRDEIGAILAYLDTIADDPGTQR